MAYGSSYGSLPARGVPAGRGAMASQKSKKPTTAILVLALSCLACLAWHAAQAPVSRATQLLQGGDAVKADESTIFDGAPQLVQKVVADANAGKATGSESLAAANRRAASMAEMDYAKNLGSVVGSDSLMAPMATSGVLQGGATSATQILEKHFESQKLDKQIQDMDPLVRAQMAEDVAHPDKAEIKEEKEMEWRYEHPEHAKKVHNLENEVQELQHLNAKLLMKNKDKRYDAKDTQKLPKPSVRAAATKRAQAVAQVGLSKAEKKAVRLTKSLVQNSQNPALLRAEKVAEEGAKVATAQVQKDTKAILQGGNKEEVKQPKLPGVMQSAWGGMAEAAFKGKQDARGIPGVKENDWPFAPGSFRYRRKKAIPGVNEYSWSVFNLGDGKKKATPGGCYPGKDGKLVCHGSNDKRLAVDLDRAIGFGDTQVKPGSKSPGTGLDTLPLITHLKEDAQQQKLDAAAAAFGDNMKDSRLEQLLQMNQHGRKQMLERIGSQCSNFFDCFDYTGNVVPHHTHPFVKASWDRNVRHDSESLSRHEMADTFKHTPRPWRIFGKWPFESGDKQVKVDDGRGDYIAHISRPSFQTKGHQKFDVAAVAPSSTKITQYRAPSSGSMLADEEILPQNMKKGGLRNHENSVGVCGTGVNCDSELAPMGRPESFMDENVPIDELPAGGIVAPWTPHMYGNKPTNYKDLEGYEPSLEELRMVGQQPYHPVASNGYAGKLVNLARARKESQQRLQETQNDAEYENPLEQPLMKPIEEEEEAEDVPQAEREPIEEEPVVDEAQPNDFIEGNYEGEPVEEVEEPMFEEDELEQPQEESSTEGEANERGAMEQAEEAAEARHEPHLPGVNVDSGWSPYKYQDVWGYDRRASHGEPGVYGEGIGKDPSTVGLSTAGGYLAHKGKMDEIEHSNTHRGQDSIKHAYESAGGQWPSWLEEHKDLPNEEEEFIGEEAGEGLEHGEEGLPLTSEEVEAARAEEEEEEEAPFGEEQEEGEEPWHDEEPLMERKQKELEEAEADAAKAHTEQARMQNYLQSFASRPAPTI